MQFNLLLSSFSTTSMQQHDSDFWMEIILIFKYFFNRLYKFSPSKALYNSSPHKHLELIVILISVSLFSPYSYSSPTLIWPSKVISYPLVCQLCIPVASLSTYSFTICIYQPFDDSYLNLLFFLCAKQPSTMETNLSY